MHPSLSVTRAPAARRCWWRRRLLCAGTLGPGTDRPRVGPPAHRRRRCDGPAKPKNGRRRGLNRRKTKVETGIKGVHQDLDESSDQLRDAAAALTSAQAQLSSARAQLAGTRGELAVARALDTRMAAELVAAKARLVRAAPTWWRVTQDRRARRTTLGQIVVQNYQSGDPSLMGLSMVLTTQDPAQLTGQLNSVQNIMDKEAVVLGRPRGDEGAADRAGVGGRGGQGRGAAKRRGGGRQTCVAQQGLESQAEAAEASVALLVDARAAGPARPQEARQADLAQLANLETERDRIAAVLKRRADRARARAAAAAAAAGGRPPRRRWRGALERVPRLPRVRAGHLAVRLAHPPHLRLPLAARRHRLRRLLRHPHPRRRRRHGAGGVLPDGLGQPDHHRPRLPARRRAGDHLQPPELATPSAAARTSSAARSSGTSGPPAGPRGATCTSRCCRTASR